MKHTLFIAIAFAVLADAAAAGKGYTVDDLEPVPPKDPREIIWQENSEV